MTSLRVLRLLFGPQAVRPATRIAALMAYAVVGAVLSALGNAFVAYASAAGPVSTLYGLMSWTATAMLAAPVLMLVESAVTATASERNDRLATLRLLGASSRLIRRLPVIESALLAAIGSTIGAVVGTAVALLVGQPGLTGAANTASGAPLGLLGIGGTVVLVTVLAMWRGSLGLRQVLIGPLGVRRRERPERVDPRALRRGLVVLGLTTAGGIVFGVQISMIGVFLVLVGIVTAMTTLRLIGPVVISGLATRAHRRAGSAAALIAARTAMEAPFAAWRRVSGVTMTTFVAVVAAGGMALLAPVSEPTIVHDVTVTTVITLACSALLTAATVTLDEVSAVLDRQALHVGLQRAGTPRAVLDGARLRGVGLPLVTMSVLALLSAALLVGPLVLGAGAISLSSVVTLGTAIAVGIGIALVGVVATGRLLPGDPADRPHLTTEPNGATS
ncbi:hypothetical protein ITJ54_17035 [Curtobacterium sp. VKM Ac-2865]|uniref:FtsX-like permease family protein n=1 Tax=Curtobacterium sp. VKM Ac-2865 TaxID=2783817 RepID=UPI00188A6566|nr:FtsX-like permease family protein [Curtobacterium sp. VKM Ac-2865]MBF4584375.1 hypothetical protein [Curtobacterium sp. VKM Ac-2865]